MSSKKNKYNLEITSTAQKNLRDIYKYSYKNWGKAVAKKYIISLEETIIEVSNGTKHLKINPNFSTHYPYCTSGKHHIFFKFQESQLIVVAIFHVQMNIKIE